MGIVNVTPDSFSDGGETFQVEQAIARGLEMRESGADILDIGGESTRPGAEPVSIEEELRRILPVIQGLAAKGALVSVDTRHSTVMKQAVEAGARIINDVTALEGDTDSVSVAASLNVPVMLMHMQGEPGNMQEKPAYQDAAVEVLDYLLERARICEAAGISKDKIALDPGIGFGKTVAHNTDILNRLGIYQNHGYTVLLGASRKRFIGSLSRNEEAQDRVPGSIAAVLAGRQRGVQIFRVHDVAETRQALSVFDAIG